MVPSISPSIVIPLRLRKTAAKRRNTLLRLQNSEKMFTSSFSSCALGEYHHKLCTFRPLRGALPKLAFKLLRKKFSGQLGAVDAFRDWCMAHGVQHEFDSWV